MYGLDLFSGIGGLALALERWVRTVAYCEQNKYAQAVLLSRMASGDLDRAPVWDDVRTLRGAMLPKKIDIITGGFPCQDISVAGRGGGLGGERSGLFFEIVRLTEETRAPFVFLENVPAIRTRGLREVIRAFTDLRYDCRWTSVSAAEVGAPHLRKRWFLLAHAKSIRSDKGSIASRRSAQISEHFVRSGVFVGDAGSERPQGWKSTKKTWEALAQHRHSGERDWPSWLPKPSLPRNHYGLSNRVDRIKCLGNAVVPLQAKTAFEKLIGKRREFEK